MRLRLQLSGNRKPALARNDKTANLTRRELELSSQCGRNKGHLSLASSDTQQQCSACKVILRAYVRVKQMSHFVFRMIY